MSDLRPEHGDCQTTAFTKNQRSREVFTCRNKSSLIKTDNWLLLQAFFFKHDMKHFHATFPKIPFLKAISEKQRMKVDVFQFPHLSTFGYS